MSDSEFTAAAGTLATGPDADLEDQPSGPWWQAHPAPTLGAVTFACFSLMPSLVPHSGVIQGITTGLAAGIGYLVGACMSWLLCWAIALPQPWRATPSGRRTIYGGSCAALLIMLVLGRTWQDDVRQAMGLPISSPLWWLEVVIVGGALLVGLVLEARSVRTLSRRLRARAERRRPGTPAAVIGVLGATAITLGVVVGGLLIGYAVIDRAFAGIDARVDSEVTQPTSTVVSGGPRSGVAWEDLGSDGRDFVSAVPTAADLTAFSPTGAQAQDPVRVYVGLRTSGEAAARAQAALSELEKLGAFDRSVLVVATSTGTGWIDRTAIEPVEYMYGGDTAVVTTQYSTLPSWLSFIVDQRRAKEAADALFEAIHDRWSSMPADSRPKLLVYGESLGAYGAESPFASVDDLAARVDGALFSGPPAVAPVRHDVTQDRDAGSPEWQPIFEEGRRVRFGSLPTDLDEPEGIWGPPRLAYLQNATDPVVWWTPRTALFRPDWLAEPLGPNVWPQMRWLPFVTFVQLTGDMLDSTSVPPGNGHVYGRNQAGAWARIVPPPGWTDADTQRLLLRFQ